MFCVFWGFSITTDGFAAGCIFPRGYFDDLVAGEAGVFGFEAAGIVAGAALFVRDPTQLEEILHNGVAPDDGVPGLVLEAGEDVCVEAGVDAPLERRPVVDEPCGLGGAVVVTVVDVLDDGFAVVQLVGVRHVVEEDEQVVGSGGWVLVESGDFRRVLSNVAGSGGDGAVHAYSQVVGVVPLAPAVAFARFDVGAVVAASDVSEGLHAERAGVVHVGGPGLHEHLCDGSDDLRVGADGLPGPLDGDLVGGEVGVPGETAEGIEVGEGERGA